MTVALLALLLVGWLAGVGVVLCLCRAAQRGDEQLEAAMGSEQEAGLEPERSRGQRSALPRAGALAGAGSD